MAAFGALFHDDATFVNRFAHYVRGVAEIIGLHKPIHETIYRDSTLTNELISVVPVSSDVAIVHFWSRLATGTAHPAGPHEVDTLILAVLTQRQGGWKIKALENVTLTNPRTGDRAGSLHHIGDSYTTRPDIPRLSPEWPRHDCDRRLVASGSPGRPVTWRQVEQGIAPDAFTMEQRGRALRRGSKKGW
jgi:uncharacterized protein (TIGR02246 family)